MPSVDSTTVATILYAAAAKDSRREADGFRTEGGSTNSVKQVRPPRVVLVAYAALLGAKQSNAHLSHSGQGIEGRD
jgi:hypothetical protein